MAPRSRAVLFLIAAVLAAVVASASAEDAKPTILTPVANTPLGSFEGADGPVADDAMEDEDAAPVGAPIGTTMTEPKPELANAPPGATEAEGDDAAASGAASVLVGASVAAFAGVVAAAFAF
ncbi:uncharacterized protein LOC112270027 [Brachypodium distachyon]|uniref:Anther-specific protein BCP1 n=1 Tax=Brachypodium distachyon TaxID=15368 RepID=I1H295_BRADI|nr:uncharacterized protein LOC112270027 [Brachypodium distachyon]PNT76762.1 hypothetical protein BRADI_1g52960v3 [Brachypodium distachyon]|eukprot:XP_024313414.1 uncharacterized protein LOC112270027 [Brachypodium distachyon]